MPLPAVRTLVLVQIGSGALCYTGGSCLVCMLHLTPAGAMPDPEEVDNGEVLKIEHRYSLLSVQTFAHKTRVRYSRSLQVHNVIHS